MTKAWRRRLRYHSRRRRLVVPLDLYEALGARRGRGGVQGGAARCLALFHRRSFTSKHFPQLCLAFCVLRDEGRRDVYDRLGLDGLRQSEAYMSHNVFDADPQTVFDNFFDCKDWTGAHDEAIRQYLLHEAAGSDDDEEIIVAKPGKRARPEDVQPPPVHPSYRRLVDARHAEWPGADAWARL